MASLVGSSLERTVGPVEPGGVAPLVGSAVQRIVSPDAPGGAPADAVAPLAGSAVSPVQRAVDSAAHGSGTGAVAPLAGAPGAGAAVQRVSESIGPRTPGLGMPVLRQHSEPSPTGGGGAPASVSDTAASAPLAGFTAQVPVLDLAGVSSAGGGESAAEPAGPQAGVVQRSAGHTSGSATVQRLVGDTPSLPVLPRSDAAGLSQATTLTSTRAGFAEPVAQRLVGSAPPIVQRVAELPSHRASEAPVVQRVFTTPAPQPPATLPVAAAPAVIQAVEQAPVVVARAVEAAPSLPAPEPVQRTVEAPAVQRAEAPQPGAQPQPQNPEELLHKLYDPLLRRLKADLWLDRERRGALTDL